MTFQPVVPLTGYTGWVFLSRTLEKQQEAHAASPARQRDTDYFAEKIGSIQTAEDLVADRRLLSVALGAFGLDDDINSQFFIRRVLEDGSTRDDAISNRLADKTYLELSRAFGFGEVAPPRTQLTGFADEIISAYEARQFEIDVGNQDESLRLALGAVRELTELSQDTTANDTKWFKIMGTPPLRSVFETAFGLPTSFGTLDLDQQLSVLRDRSSAVLGTDEIADFADETLREDLVKTFLLRSQLQSGLSQAAPGSVALQLLSGGVGAP